MIKTSLLFLSCCFLLACSKSDNPEILPAPPPSFDMPVNPGSLWVYEWYNMYADGSESATGMIDTVQVIGDTIISDLTYAVFRGQYLTPTVRTSYVRDDGTAWIDEEGGTLFDYTAFEVDYGFGNTDLGLDPEISFHFSDHDLLDQEIEVPAGTFGAIDHRDSRYYSGYPQLNPCCDTVLVKSRKYAPGIGEISSSTAYWAQYQYNCTRIERRLISFDLAE